VWRTNINADEVGTKSDRIYTIELKGKRFSFNALRTGGTVWHYFEARGICKNDITSNWQSFFGIFKPNFFFLYRLLQVL